MPLTDLFGQPAWKYSQAHQQALRQAYEEAGVSGVPMFVIGSQVLTAVQEREPLAAVIDEEIPTTQHTQTEAKG